MKLEDAVGELAAARGRIDALESAVRGALATYEIHRKVRHPSPLPDCVTCGMGASLVRNLPADLLDQDAAPRSES